MSWGELHGPGDTNLWCIQSKKGSSYYSLPDTWPDLITNIYIYIYICIVTIWLIVGDLKTGDLHWYHLVQWTDRPADAGGKPGRVLAEPMTYTYTNGQGSPEGTSQDDLKSNSNGEGRVSFQIGDMGRHCQLTKGDERGFNYKLLRQWTYIIRAYNLKPG